MNPYLIRYQTLDTKDLIQILDIYNDLVLPAKRALVEIIEKSPDRNEYDDAKFQKLIQSIEEEVVGIENLQYVDWLGISLFEDNNEITIKKNKQAKSRDRWSIIIGSLLTFLLIPAVLSLFELYNKFDTSQFVLFVIVSILGSIGLSLLMKTIDRIMKLKKFVLMKNKHNITLKNCPDTFIKEETYPADSKLITIKNGESIKLALKVNEESTIDIITFKNLEPVLNETVSNMADKFNQW